MKAKGRRGPQNPQTRLTCTNDKNDMTASAIRTQIVRIPNSAFWRFVSATCPKDRE